MVNIGGIYEACARHLRNMPEIRGGSRRGSRGGGGGAHTPVGIGGGGQLFWVYLLSQFF